MLIKKRIRTIVNWINLVATLILFIAVLFLYTDYSAQLPLKITLFVVILQFVVFQIIGRRTRIYACTDQCQYDQNENIKIGFSINKRSFYPFKMIYVSVEYQNRYSGKKISKLFKLELNDKRNQVNYFQIGKLHCGYTDIKIKSVYLYDLLGFMSLKLRQKFDPVAILVMPVPNNQRIELNQIPCISWDEETMFSNEKQNNNSNEIFDFREFRNGDSLNKVHWKLSIKADELMVREFNKVINTDVYVYVNLDHTVNIDAMLENAITISYQLIREKYAFYLTWFDVEQMQLNRKLISKEEDIEICFMKIL